ncbi:MAG: CDP-glucose 4,6-dehydratase [Magnetococcales bacterium]|nr:CDP-glucose 4,6-dehydratase [Magnetococcales bacterium]
MTPDFWQGKRVFITGHTGFKGSWLALWLTKCGARVTGYALEPATTPNLFDSANVSEGMVSIIGDIRNFENLAQAMLEHKPDIVIHMAAQALVRPSYSNPLDTFSTNVMGTANLLEAVRHTPTVRVVINVTSDKCYENRELAEVGYKEDDPMGGHDPYSSSKGCAELVAAAYRNSYFQSKMEGEHQVAMASVRAGNVIGGGDWAVDRLIPDTIAAFMDNRPVEIRSPKAIRPWQHVLEALGGYLLLAEKLWEDGSEYTGGWNFGPESGDTIPVVEIVEAIAKIWGAKASWCVQPGEQPHEAHYLRLDCSKARSKLGWKNRWDVHKGLSATVNWYQVFAKNGDVRGESLQQIDQFMAATPL